MLQSAVSEEGKLKDDAHIRAEGPDVVDGDVGCADGWETDEEELGENGPEEGTRSLVNVDDPSSSTSRPDVASTSSVPAITSAHAATRVLPESLTESAESRYLTGPERKERRRQWKKRIRHLSMCAKSTDIITSLMAEIKQNNVLLASQAFSSLPDSERTRLTEQQASLQTRLEDEKLLDIETRAQLIRLIMPPIADEAARERVAKMKEEREVMVEKERKLEERWELGKTAKAIEKEFKARDRLALERHEAKLKEKQERERKANDKGKGKEKAASTSEAPPPLFTQSSPQKPIQQAPLLATGKLGPPPKRKTRRKKSKQKKKRRKKLQQEGGEMEIETDLDDGAEQDVGIEVEDGELPEEHAQEPQQPEPEEGELLEDPSGAPQDHLAARADQQLVSKVADGKKDEHVEMRVEAVRLRDEVAKMKRVLIEMREMSRQRLAQSERDAVPPRVVGSGKRKLESDAADDDDAWQDLSSASASNVGPVGDVHTARVELETLLREIIGIRTHVETETSHSVIEGRIRVAFDDARARRAAALEEKRRAQTSEQEHFHAEVEDKLAQIAQQTAAFNTQIWAASGDLSGCRTRLDAVARDVERETAQSSEMRKRVDQIQAAIRSYGDLHAQNSAAISDIRAKLDACSREAEFHLPDSASDPPSPPTQPIYPNPQEISDSLSSFMADSTQPLLDRTRREIATLLEQNSRRMHHAVDSRMHHTLNAVENSIKRSMASHSRHSNSNPLQP